MTFVSQTINYYDNDDVSERGFTDFLNQTIEGSMSGIEVANLTIKQINDLTSRLLMTPGAVNRLIIHFNDSISSSQLEDILDDISLLDNIDHLRLSGLNQIGDEDTVRAAIATYEEESGNKVMHDLHDEPKAQTKGGYTYAKMESKETSVTVETTAGHMSDPVPETPPQGLSAAEEEDANVHLARLKDIASKWKHVQTERPVATSDYRLFEHLWKTRSDLFQNAIGIYGSA